MESKREAIGTDNEEGEELCDYDIEFCDDTDTDDNENIEGGMENRGSAASVPSLCKIEGGSTSIATGSSVGNMTPSISGGPANKLRTFTLLDVEVIYKLCSTTVLFKTSTMLHLIQVHPSALKIL